MKTKTLYAALSLFFLWATQAACNLLAATPSAPDTFATLNALYTASAQTLTSLPTQQASPTPGLPPPAAITDSVTLPTIAPVQPPCDSAAFVKDITYSDGSVISAESKFIKTWRIENTGKCAWTSAYALVFSGGERMNSPLAIYLLRVIQPGETADIQAPLTSPKKSGEYRGYWMLQNASGALFGVGADSQTPLWADIVVYSQTYTAYDFASKACQAEWENANKSLPCPGSEGERKGYVLALNSAILEKGERVDSPALFISPQQKANGILRGEYPAFLAQAGDRFRAWVSCANGAKRCDMTFRLDYKLNGETYTLGSWREAYEGQRAAIDVDLEKLAGKKVRFILYASAGGEYNQDEGLWINPRITRLGEKPAPANTKVPTATRTPIPPTPTFTLTLLPPSETATLEPPTPTLETPTPTDTPIP